MSLCHFSISFLLFGILSIDAINGRQYLRKMSTFNQFENVLYGSNARMREKDKSFPVRRDATVASDAYRNLFPQGPTIASSEVSSFPLCVSIAESSFGTGLFVSINGEGEAVTVPRGTLFCEYKGCFQDDQDNDKSVSFGFRKSDQFVYFNKKLIPLYQAVLEAATASSNLKGAIEGHSMEVVNNIIEIELNPEYTKTSFIPFADGGDGEGGTNLACRCNDFAYVQGVTVSKELYDAKYPNNCLMLIWKLESQNGRLVPINPVLVSKAEMTFDNREPMELGVSYSWDYWLAFNYNCDSGRYDKYGVDLGYP
jgi:hypothetical protein